MSEWMTELEAAEWLGVPIDAVRQAIATGALNALRLGEHVRISRTATIDAVSVSSSSGPFGVSLGVRPTAAGAELLAGLPAPIGLEWRARPTPAEPFEHPWPRNTKKYGPGPSIEKYPVAWNAVVSLLGQRVDVQMGESEPRGDGRPRLSVFFNRYPEAEFARTANGDGWASAVKLDGKATLRPGDPVPALYRRSRLLPYQEATGFTGPGRTKGMALIINASDVESAVHHAAARWLGKRGRALEPAA